MESKKEIDIKKIKTNDLLKTSMDVCMEAKGSGRFPSEINNQVFCAAYFLLEDLQKDACLTREQLIEKHDVIMMGVFALALRGVFVHHYTETIGFEFYGILKKQDDPLLTQDLMLLASINTKEKDEDALLIIGVTILFNKVNRQLFKPENYNNWGRKFITEDAKQRFETIYVEGYEPKNNYPFPKHSLMGMYQQLKAMSNDKRKPFVDDELTLLKKHPQPEQHIRLIASRYKSMLTFVPEAEKVILVARQQRDTDFKLDEQSIRALLQLTPGIKTWLLQGYQLMTTSEDKSRPPLLKEIIKIITSLLLNISDKQSDNVQKFIVYSMPGVLKKNPVLTLMDNLFFGKKSTSNIEPKKPEQRLMKTAPSQKG